MAIIW